MFYGVEGEQVRPGFPGVGFTQHDDSGGGPGLISLTIWLQSKRERGE